MADLKSHKLLVSLSVLVLIGGLVFITKAAASDPIVRLPGGATTEGSGTVRSIESGAQNFSEGIDLGRRDPTGSPSETVQPIPEFSGLNAPWWLNENGPAEIPDDTILHGLVDVRGGLVNNGPGAGVAAGTPPLVNNISLSSDAEFPNPAGGSVSRGTTNHVAARFAFKAPSTGGMNISSIVVTRTGTSLDNYFSNIKIFEEISGGSAVQLGGTVVSLSSGKATFNLATPWSIAASGTKVLRISTDITATAALSSTFQFGIARASDVTSSVGLRGTFPLNGNSFTVTAPPVVRTVSVGYEPSGVSGGSIAAGTNGATLSKFHFTATGTDDVMVTGITLSKSGLGAATDVKNIKLYDGATQIGATDAALSASSDAVFTGLSWIVPQGETKVITVKGDVSATASIGSTFSFGIDAEADIQAADSAVVDIEGGTSTSGEAEFTIVAPPPTFTLSRNPTPAANSTLAAGTGKAILEMDASLSSGTKRLSKVYVTPLITGNPAANSIANYKLQRKDASGVWRDIQSAAPEAMLLKPSDPSSTVLSFPVANTALADVSTSVVKLRIVADIACVGAPATIDFVVENDSHLFFTASPYPTISRSINSVAQKFPICVAAAPHEGSSFTASVLGSGIFPEASATEASSGLFGVQTAKAFTLIELVPIFGALADKTLKNPVTVYDDLFIQGTGNAEEPGDLILSGGIYSAGFRGGAMNVLPIYSNIFTDQGLWVLGPTEVNELTVSAGLKAYNGIELLTGDLVIGGAGSISANHSTINILDIDRSAAGGDGYIQFDANTANSIAIYQNGPDNALWFRNTDGTKATLNAGTVKADNIGAYYRLNTTSAPKNTVGDFPSVEAKCGDADILVSCSGTVSSTTNTVFSGTSMSTRSCTAKGSVTVAGVNKTLTAQAVCFNPDRTDVPTNILGAKTDL